jgi:hypothetical protein
MMVHIPGLLMTYITNNFGRSQRISLQHEAPPHLYGEIVFPQQRALIMAQCQMHHQRRRRVA